MSESESEVLRTFPSVGLGLGLTIPQRRVIQVLGRAKGPMTRSRIAEACGNKTPVVVQRAVGYNDPTKRAVFERSKDGGNRPSLLTLGLVEEVHLKIPEDGIDEVAIALTPAGRKKYEEVRNWRPPAMRKGASKD